MVDPRCHLSNDTIRSVPLLGIYFLDVRASIECIGPCDSIQLWTVWKAIRKTHKCGDILLGHCHIQCLLQGVFEFRIMHFDGFRFGEAFREGYPHPHRNDKQWSFCEDHLVSFDVTFREKTNTHVRRIFGENDVGWVQRWQGRVEAWGVHDLTTG